MAKVRSVYQCNQCGSSFPRWNGKCPDCGTWGSISEEKVPLVQKTSGAPAATPQQTISLEQVTSCATSRIPTSMEELEPVLGGGLVPGSMVLLGGDPGIGKSTLTMQLAGNLCKDGLSILYISGEESLQQLKMRADRLGTAQGKIFVCTSTSLEEVLALLQQTTPQLLIIDSIQTLSSQELDSAAGTVSQIRHCTAALMEQAKANSTATILVGHVTKEGVLAGPRVLEHLVDVVLYFEGDRFQNFRILRSVKNRFGSTNEVGIFEMTAQGLVSVDNPSQMLLAEKPEMASGSVATATMEGTRPLIVEIQSLVSSSFFGNPVRSTIGIDHSRVNMILAVLEKKLGMNISNNDVYTNIIGGIKINETSGDLAVAAALVSSFRNIPLDKQLLIFGEIGLCGEVRSVSQAQLRIQEGRKLGFHHFIVPEQSAKKIPLRERKGITGVSSVEEVMDHLFR
ncbi:DNA repair protein RadA [Desulfurispirillum indicum]|uniref:DNA repair protein RadA n=1 Tax=Desulfurispirillum indicum (strain ATCC BAA-1389 / DSM 22839 / S5) TaxID=653733 RepID=E6W7B4_DESIS|nr:DNA repair protein RadA [Desulfurispirillum indicum]ADU66281.1 DNA repair protein RadA [Desulfurispirillum indicum S5]UCZ55612.1 DNA repair protein RadA [Desulfurispirillum indicum]